MRNNRDSKICSAQEAVALIKNGDAVACSGFIGAVHPEALSSAIEARFMSEQQPRDLTLVYAAGQGDAKTRGLNHLAHEGLLRRVVGGHWGLAPGLGRLATEGKIEAYNFPQGVIAVLFRDIAAGRPGCITHIGLGTFIDPEFGGGRMNDITPNELVERVVLNGKTWLFYKAFPINIALIRATSADPFGNLSMSREALFGEALPIAQAARNSGGIVLAQVAELLDKPIPPQSVDVPGIFVDKIVVADPHDHAQTFGEEYNSKYCEPMPAEFEMESLLPPLAPGPRRIVVSRAFEEIHEGNIVNLGIGMPEGIACIAAERGFIEHFTLTVESGPIGGAPAGGLNFGASVYPQAIIGQPAQFDFYDGGGLDFAALGAAEIDEQGNVNVSKFGPRLPGVGGFVNITQTAKSLAYCGTFTVSGLEVAMENGKLRIVTEGKGIKFVKAVEQVSYSAKHAIQTGQRVLYITERAVFKLTPEGLELIEVAPGISIEEHILPYMQFRPIIRNVREMSAQAFI